MVASIGRVFAGEIKIFREGSAQQDQWQSENCDKCKKNWENNPRNGCDIEAALMAAFFSCFRVEKDIASRMGYNEDDYTWECPEIERSDIG